MHYIQYMWTALERLSRGIYNKPRGPLSSEIIRWFSGQSDGKLDLTKGIQRYSKLSQLKGGHQARIHSDQMVLVMARCQSFLLSFHLLYLLIRLFALSTYLSICSIYLFVYLLYLLIFYLLHLVTFQFALSAYFNFLHPIFLWVLSTYLANHSIYISFYLLSLLIFPSLHPLVLKIHLHEIFYFHFYHQKNPLVP